MFEGRANASGLAIVAVALAALVAFTALLYVRGASGPHLPIVGAIGGPTPVPTIPRTPAPTASPSAAASGASSSPGRSVTPTAGGSATGATTGTPGPTTGPTSSPRPTATPRPSATPQPTASPKPTPRPTRTPRPTATSGGAAFQLPANPQTASVSLDNGKGNCDGFPSGGVVVSTTYRIRSPGQLTATSPLGQLLIGTIAPNGTFTLSGQSPVESWNGRLTGNGGSGTYSVVSNGCTESYTSTITYT